MGKTVGEGVPPGAQVDMGGGELTVELVGLVGLVADGDGDGAEVHPASRAAIRMKPDMIIIFFNETLPRSDYL